jgi:Domain of unknown function (DUF4326)
METTLCNVRVKYLRPKYDNLKEWIEDENNVYIGRKGIVFVNGVRYPKENSVWHNPFKGEGCIDRFRVYILEKLKDKDLLTELIKLKGKNLGCWCHPEPCHGNVVMEIISYFTYDLGI